MNLDIASFTSEGPRRRNEDAFVAHDLGNGDAVIGVADGLGGHAGGDVAANYAVRRFAEMISGTPMPNLKQIAGIIHAEIQEMQTVQSELKGMSTTLSAGYFSGSHFKGVHCGDSRIAVSRGGGIKRLTEDHTEVQRLLKTGQLSREAARIYPRRNVLDSALGASAPLQLDEVYFKTQPGDRFFFTTDGAHGKVLLREMQRISQHYEKANEVVSALVREIETRDPTDNYTIVCCFVI